MKPFLGQSLEVTKNEEPVQREDNNSKIFLESEIVYEESIEREDNSSKKSKIICEEPIEQEYEPACEESNSKALVESAN